MNHTPAVFVSFKRADLAATAAELIVANAADLENTGGSATSEQVDMATRLRAKADRLFKTAMTEWAKLPSARK
ncbi:MAG: hypothetical protein H7322_03330 [Ramlibacter sp.]|nr:hypothetical protein [Ramlibacter sp.]